MTRIEASVVIPAPLSEVFPYASDWRVWPEWFEGVFDFRPTTDVARGNGARYAYKARLLGLVAKVETEVTEFVEGRGWKGIARKGMPHATYWLFEPTDGHTRFTYALEYELPLPIVGRLLDSLLLKRQWRRIIATSLDNLRRHFERRRAGSEAAAGSLGA